MNLRNLTLSILFFCLVSMGFRCKDLPLNFDHNFQAQVDIFPLKKIYSLTDTIWIETDLPNKLLFDTKSNQNINADTGQIPLIINYNEFASTPNNPTNGVCDVITINGVNKNRYVFPGSVQAYLEYGCGQPDYKTRIGFKPNYKGYYSLILGNDHIFENCPNKVIKSYSILSFRFKNIDLNMDILNSIPEKDRGTKEGTNFYTEKVNNREMFVFKVE